MMTMSGMMIKVKKPTKLGDGEKAWLRKNLKTRLTFVMGQFLEILVHLKT